MPILNVKVSATKSPELTRQIADLLLELTTRILKKERSVTAIAIDYIDHDCWVVGGSLLSEQGKNSFYFDIKITDETNTKAENAQYIREAFDGFARILGNLHDESYIYVQDVRATSYGYGGLTPGISLPSLGPLEHVRAGADQRLAEVGLAVVPGPVLVRVAHAVGAQRRGDLVDLARVVARRRDVFDLGGLVPLVGRRGVRLLRFLSPGAAARLSPAALNGCRAPCAVLVDLAEVALRCA